MELLLERKIKTDKSTIGELWIDGKFDCYTLEDVEREVKIKGKTAIQKGRYEVVINWSNRFKQFMPLLLNVPNFEGIRIHTGNTEKDTEGCVLVGRNHDYYTIRESRLAYKHLFAKLKTASKQEKIFITIK